MTSINLTKEGEEITSGKLYESYMEISKTDAVTYRRIFDFINELANGSGGAYL